MGTKITPFKLEDEYREKLAYLAEVNKVSMAEIVRWLVRQAYNEQKAFEKERENDNNTSASNPS